MAALPTERATCCRTPVPQRTVTYVASDNSFIDVTFTCNTCGDETELTYTPEGR